MDMRQWIELLGAPFGIIVAILYSTYQLRQSEQRAIIKASESNTEQEKAITVFAQKFDTDKDTIQKKYDEVQVSNNHLQAEIFAVRLEQAKEAGRRDELKEAMQRERDEWKAERVMFDEKFRKMETRILELEKHREQSNLRISELEYQIAELERKLASANVEIDILQAQKRELETLLTYERNRAETLNSLVTQIRAIENSASDKTVAIPDMVWNEDTEATVITVPNPHDDSKPVTPDSANPPLTDAA